MASLFDKKEINLLSVLIYNILLFIFMVLNNNPKIKGIPFVYISFRVIQIIFSIYILLKGLVLIKVTFDESKKRTLLEIIQIIFIIFLMILALFVTVENIIHTASYISIFLI